MKHLIKAAILGLAVGQTGTGSVNTGTELKQAEAGPLVCNANTVERVEKSLLITWMEEFQESCLIDPKATLGQEVRYNDITEVAFFYNKTEDTLFLCEVKETEACQRAALACEAGELCINRRLCVQYLRKSEKNKHCFDTPKTTVNLIEAGTPVDPVTIPEAEAK